MDDLGMKNNTNEKALITKILGNGMSAVFDLSRMIKELSNNVVVRMRELPSA